MNVFFFFFFANVVKSGIGNYFIPHQVWISISILFCCCCCCFRHSFRFFIETIVQNYCFDSALVIQCIFDRKGKKKPFFLSLSFTSIDHLFSDEDTIPLFKLYFDKNLIFSFHNSSAFFSLSSFFFAIRLMSRRWDHVKNKRKTKNSYFSIPMHYTQSKENVRKYRYFFLSSMRQKEILFSKRYTEITKFTWNGRHKSGLYHTDLIDYTEHEQQQLYRIKYVLTY